MKVTLTRRLLFLCIFCAFFVALFLSVLLMGWDRGWALVSVFSHQESFNDIRILHAAVLSAADGFDPTIENPRHFAGKLMNYPQIWLTIATVIDFGNETKFLTITIFYLAVFFASLAYFVFRFPSLTLLLAGISGVVVTPFETGNVDTIFFVLLLITALISNNIFRYSLILACSALKFFPIFAIPVLIKWDKRKSSLPTRFIPALVVAGIFLIFLAINYTSIRHALEITPKSGWDSYGMWVVAFLIDERAPDIGIGLFELYLLFAVSVTPVLYYSKHLAQLIRFPTLKTDPDFQLKRDLFLIGGFIYVASYLATSNWDYRMMFTIFAVPFVLSTGSRPVRIAFSVSLIIAMNQFLLIGIHRTGGGAVNILAKASLHYILTVLLIAYCIPKIRDWIRPSNGVHHQSTKSE